MEIKTSIFATSKDVGKIIPPLQSRFFIVKLEPYTYEQFHHITLRLGKGGHTISKLLHVDVVYFFGIFV
jgi:hypothetical protein